MRLRRSRGSDEDATKVPGEQSSTEAGQSAEGKGRATPSRKQVEAERKERLRASARGEKVSGRGSTTSSSKKSSKEERADLRRRAIAGDERVLAARDRGPERKYARDLVDKRHTVGEYFLYLAIFVLIIGLIRVQAFAIGSQILLAVVVLALVVDSIRIRGQVTRAVAEKFPNGNLDGIGRYAMTRAMVTRRMRVPAPQVKRGG